MNKLARTAILMLAALFAFGSFASPLRTAQGMTILRQNGKKTPERLSRSPTTGMTTTGMTTAEASQVVSTATIAPAVATPE